MPGDAKVRLLNVGCGDAFDPAWTNLDLVARPGVQAHELRSPLPFPDGSFEGAYASHVLEHLEPAAGARLLRELHRVLAPGGVVRIVVPDLEALAREYLAALDRARSGDAAGYDWAAIELLDQLVRDRPGGEMARVLRDPPPPLRETIARRLGDEVLSPPAHPPALTLGRVLREIRWRAARAAATLTGGSAAGAALAEGRFRRDGEVHRWMYDSFSLGRALAEAGFTAPRPVRFDESALPSFSLDGREGKPRKPDSLYMEARR